MLTRFLCRTHESSFSYVTFGRWAVVSVLLVGCFFARGKERHKHSDISPASQSKEWFHLDATVQPLTLQAIREEVLLGARHIAVQPEVAIKMALLISTDANK